MERPICSKCRKEVAKNPVTCEACTKSFHPGCVNFSTVLHSGRETKCCQACYQACGSPTTARTAAGSADTRRDYAVRSRDAAMQPARAKTLGSSSSPTTAPDLSDKLDAIFRQLQELHPIRNQLRELATLTAERFSSLENGLKETQEQCQRFESTVMDLTAKNEELTEVCATLRQTLHETREKLCRIETAERAKELIISGVPAVERGEVVSTALSIFRTLGCNLDSSDIMDAFVLRKAPGAASSICVKLKNKSARNAIFAARRERNVPLRTTDVNPLWESRAIYLNENHPSDVYKLFVSARRYLREANLEGIVSARNGTVQYRRNKQSAPSIIRNLEDLTALVNAPRAD